MKKFLFGTEISENISYEVVYLLFRLHAGFSIAIGAGLSKVFHKINEEGGEQWSNLEPGVPDWFIKQVSEIGFTLFDPALWAYLAVYGEFIGGLLIALGLFTRLSSFQLAFQFFVIAFIWFDEPMPIFGMYYQQLFFWSFVLISVKGGGKYSIDHYLLNEKISGIKILKTTFIFLLIFIFSGPSFSQTKRVNFIVSNSSLKSKIITFKSIDKDTKNTSGYGYSLKGLSSHAVNMPSPVRIYDANDELIYIVKESGINIKINKQYKISEEDRIQASKDEMEEEKSRNLKTASDESMESKSEANHLKMITVRIKGKSIIPSTIYIKAVLPWSEDNGQNGFSESLNIFKVRNISYPEGTKLYLCDKPYWNGSIYKSRLIAVLDKKSENALFKL